MSYARLGGDSDVYVFKTVVHHNTESRGTGWVCCSCRFSEGDDTICYTLGELAEHLRKHVSDGDRVPEYTFERILSEQQEREDLG